MATAHALLGHTVSSLSQCGVGVDGKVDAYSLGNRVLLCHDGTFAMWKDVDGDVTAVALHPSLPLLAVSVKKDLRSRRSAETCHLYVFWLGNDDEQLPIIVEPVPSYTTLHFTKSFLFAAAKDGVDVWSSDWRCRGEPIAKIASRLSVRVLGFTSGPLEQLVSFDDYEVSRWSLPDAGNKSFDVDVCQSHESIEGHSFLALAWCPATTSPLALTSKGFLVRYSGRVVERWMSCKLSTPQILCVSASTVVVGGASTLRLFACATWSHVGNIALTHGAHLVAVSAQLPLLKAFCVDGGLLRLDTRNATGPKLGGLEAETVFPGVVGAHATIIPLGANQFIVSEQNVLDWWRLRPTGTLQFERRTTHKFPFLSVDANAAFVCGVDTKGVLTVYSTEGVCKASLALRELSECAVTVGLTIVAVLIDKKHLTTVSLSSFDVLSEWPLPNSCDGVNALGDKVLLAHGSYWTVVNAERQSILQRIEFRSPAPPVHAATNTAKKCLVSCEGSKALTFIDDRFATKSVGLEHRVWNVALDETGEIGLACCDDTRVRVIALRNGRVIDVLNGHRQIPSGAIWLGGGKYVVSFDIEDKCLVLWKMGREVLRATAKPRRPPLVDLEQTKKRLASLNLMDAGRPPRPSRHADPAELAKEVLRTSGILFSASRIENNAVGKWADGAQQFFVNCKGRLPVIASNDTATSFASQALSPGFARSAEKHAADDSHYSPRKALLPPTPPKPTTKFVPPPKLEPARAASPEADVVASSCDVSLSHAGRLLHEERQKCHTPGDAPERSDSPTIHHHQYDRPDMDGMAESEEGLAHHDSSIVSGDGVNASELDAGMPAVTAPAAAPPVIYKTPLVPAPEDDSVLFDADPVEVTGLPCPSMPCDGESDKEPDAVSINPDMTLDVDTGKAPKLLAVELGQGETVQRSESPPPPMPSTPRGARDHSDPASTVRSSIAAFGKQFKELTESMASLRASNDPMADQMAEEATMSLLDCVGGWMTQGGAPSSSAPMQQYLRLLKRNNDLLMEAALRMSQQPKPEEK